MNTYFVFRLKGEVTKCLPAAAGQESGDERLEMEILEHLNGNVLSFSLVYIELGYWNGA